MSEFIPLKIPAWSKHPTSDSSRVIARGVSDSRFQTQQYAHSFHFKCTGGLVSSIFPIHETKNGPCLNINQIIPSKKQYHTWHFAILLCNTPLGLSPAIYPKSRQVYYSWQAHSSFLPTIWVLMFHPFLHILIISHRRFPRNFNLEHELWTMGLWL